MGQDSASKYSYTLGRLFDSTRPQYLRYMGWVNSIRESFDCDKKSTCLKRWEWLLLILLSFSKEILTISIHTYSADATLAHLTRGSVLPFVNDEVFWVIILKLIPGYIFLIYLNLRYQEKITIWRIWIFWAWVILLPSLRSLGEEYEIVKEVSNTIPLIVNCVFFVYFFIIDTVHIDSLKMLIYENLTIDEITGRVYRTPNSRISKSKLKQLAGTTAILIVAAIALLMVVTAIKKALTPKPPSGAEKKEEVPRNQQAIEKIIKVNPINIAFHSIIVAPIVEECIYRRFIMKEGGYHWWTIPMSGFIFGIIHIWNKEGFVVLIPYMTPGIVFSCAMWITRNIWHSTIAHSVFNLMTVIKMII